MKAELPPELIALGRIGAAHGIKGWLRIISFTKPLENILDYRVFKVADDGGRVLGEIELDQARTQGKGLVGHIKGCDDPNQAREYVGRELLVEKSELPALDRNDFYWHQLEGLRVLTRSGEELGRVAYMLATGANDVMVVRTGDAEERLIPWLPGQVIDEVDLAAGTIRVDWEADY
ncbi:MAG: ribosome maturation factor RimM [Pseudomonadales bacterium]|nr:ribosome maturation factor RimM [Pseudomonadales bacterium]